MQMKQDAVTPRRTHRKNLERRFWRHVGLLIASIAGIGWLAWRVPPRSTHAPDVIVADPPTASVPLKNVPAATQNGMGIPQIPPAHSPDATARRPRAAGTPRGSQMPR